MLRGSRRTLNLPEHILRVLARPVDFSEVDRPRRQQLVRGMLEALNTSPTGSGMAAPMAGIGLRVVVARVDDEVLALVNPEVVSTEGPETTVEEGNLCLPGVKAPVIRPSVATIRWQTVNTGSVRTRRFEGWLARVLLHEIEILDGVLFTDHASEMPLGVWRSSERLALAATAAIYGEDIPATRTNEDPAAVMTAEPGLLGIDSALRRPASPVDVATFDARHLRALVESMLRIQHEHHGVGLAAPQIGLGLRLAVIDNRVDPPLVLINPKITDHGDEVDDVMEGCLSIPGWRGGVTRPTAVSVETDTVTGDAVVLDLTGHLARVAQHEIDHLDGVLYIDRMDKGRKLVPIDPDTAAGDGLAQIIRSEAAISRTNAEAVRSNRGKGKVKGRKR